MSVVKIPDGSGNTMTVLDLDGERYPTFPVDVIKSVPHLRLRDDDILLCGYPKSGTHMVWEAARALLRGECRDDGTEKDSLMLEQVPYPDMEKMSSPRVLNTHFKFSHLPRDVVEKKLRVIYLLRNPKDSAVSFYNHHVKLIDYYDYHGTFQNYLPLWTDGNVDYGSWFDHIQSWTRGLRTHPDIPAFIVHYEDFLQNPVNRLKELSTFLGKSHSDSFIEEVKEWVSFESMRNRKGKHDLSRDGEPIMYRKGKVGNWKEWFTVAQNEWFDKILQEKVKDINVKFTYS